MSTVGELFFERNGLVYFLMIINFRFQETLHKNHHEEVEEDEEAKYDKPAPLAIPINLSRAGSRKYTVCEGIGSPAMISPFGSFAESKFEDAWHQNAEKRRSQNYDRFRNRSSSLRSRVDGEDTHDSDGYKALPGTDTSNDAPGEANDLSH